MEAINELEIDRIPLKDAQTWLTKDASTVSSVIKRLYEEIRKETSNTKPSDADKRRLEDAQTLLRAIKQVLDILQIGIEDS